MTKKSIEEIIQDSLKMIPDLNINSTVSNLMSSHFPVLSRGRQMSLKKIIAEIDEYENDDNIDLNDTCETCKKKIDGHIFYSLRKYEEVQLEDDLEYRIEDRLEDQLVECRDFCSTACLKVFSNNNEETIEEYDLYNVRRCSGYYDCLDLENLRGICEKQERLDYEAGILMPNLHNFCEPADAGIIKASINIKKQLDEGSKQNKIHFILTTFMTLLVIFLTIMNMNSISETNYENQLESMNAKLGAINSTFSYLNDQLGAIISDYNSDTNLINNNLLSTLDNTSQTADLVNKS